MSEIDETEPTRPFLTARWTNLAMLNYEIEPADLAALVPAGTELDDFGGRTFVSLVGFQFRDTRVLGIPVPFHRHFEEVNLRFYVRRDDDRGRRRGVVFVKEIVPRAAIAWIARRLYNENYVALPMTHRHDLRRRPTGSGASVSYGWTHRGRSNRLEVHVAGSPSVPDESSEESFITEHYWGYVRQRNGTTLEYRVAHPRWSVWRASKSDLDCDVAAIYGPEFVSALSGAPSSAFLAQGSEVAVHRGRTLVG